MTNRRFSHFLVLGLALLFAQALHAQTKSIRCNPPGNKVNTLSFRIDFDNETVTEIYSDGPGKPVHAKITDTNIYWTDYNDYSLNRDSLMLQVDYNAHNSGPRQYECQQTERF